MNLTSGVLLCPCNRFHPPPPFYKIKFNDATGAYDIEFSPLAAHMEYENLTVDLIRTKTKTTIPVLCLRYPGAKLTLIYSHGNATDCGAMFIMYAMLALTLKINVVGYDYTGYGSSVDSGVRPTEKQTYKGTNIRTACLSVDCSCHWNSLLSYVLHIWAWISHICGILHAWVSS